MDSYRKHVNSRFRRHLRDTQELQKWSVDCPQDFWIDLYQYLELTPALAPSIRIAYDESASMSSNPEFFKEHLLNYAENVLFAHPDPDAVALIGLREDTDLDKEDGEKVTWKELRERVRVVSSALRRSGIHKGDRVAALVSNSVYAVILFIATSTLGAIFTSINPDLGVEAS